MTFEQLRAGIYDNCTRARSIVLLLIGAAAAAAALLLTGCGELHALELEPGDVDAGADLGPDLGEPGELAPLEPDAGTLGEHDAAALELGGPQLEPDAGELEHADAGEPTTELGLYPWIFSQPFARCEGHWVDPSDISTRLTAHPDTGRCTFSCVWLEPKCHEPWYGDQRCYPAHAAVLGQLCAELGGSCDFDAARSSRYCVVP